MPPDRSSLRPTPVDDRNNTGPPTKTGADFPMFIQIYEIQEQKFWIAALKLYLREAQKVRDPQKVVQRRHRFVDEKLEQFWKRFPPGSGSDEWKAHITMTIHEDFVDVESDAKLQQWSGKYTR
ncbi:hypothetical protein C8J56DRAFT_1176993 [Mycena floridula]|nr:hypothetical protein C8J56DRAFT_1176993 [Mycena floridula]